MNLQQKPLIKQMISLVIELSEHFHGQQHILISWFLCFRLFVVLRTSINEIVFQQNLNKNKEEGMNKNNKFLNIHNSNRKNSP